MPYIACYASLLLSCWFLSGCHISPREPEQLEIPDRLLSQSAQLDKTRRPEEQCGQLLIQAESYWSQAERGLTWARQTIYHLVARDSPSLLLPLLESRPSQNALIGLAFRNQRLAQLALSEQDGQNVQNLWQKLTECDRDFLQAAVIIAQLRQNGRAFLTDQDYQRLVALPMMAEWEQRRTEIALLDGCCRQLVCKNPTLTPPYLP